MDWREIGGAPLLGVEGVASSPTARSDGAAIENAVARAADGARASCTDEIGEVAALAAGLLERERDAAEGNASQAPQAPEA